MFYLMPPRHIDSTLFGRAAPAERRSVKGAWRRVVEVAISTRGHAPCRGKVPPNKCSYLLANNTVGDVRGA
jgi:hypothetical protein